MDWPLGDIKDLVDLVGCICKEYRQTYLKLKSYNLL